MTRREERLIHMTDDEREERKIDCDHWLANFDAVITDLFVHCSVGAIMANRDLNAPLAEYAEQLFDIATRLNNLAAQLNASRRKADSHDGR